MQKKRYWALRTDPAPNAQNLHFLRLGQFRAYTSMSLVKYSKDAGNGVFRGMTAGHPDYNKNNLHQHLNKRSTGITDSNNDPVQPIRDSSLNKVPDYSSFAVHSTHIANEGGIWWLQYDFGESFFVHAVLMTTGVPYNDEDPAFYHP